MKRRSTCGGCGDRIECDCDRCHNCNVLLVGAYDPDPDDDWCGVDELDEDDRWWKGTGFRPPWD